MSDGTTTSDDAAQTLGGRYLLGEMLGHGGMAEVRKAHDSRLDRVVAVKMLRSDLARDATFQARFRREAQSAASLNAPSVVAVYDTGDGTLHGAHVPYIVMEYVEGQTLRDLLRSGQRLLQTRALEITAGVLEALDYSHEHGIIHRDVKPANVMLSSAGQVKVMDFGIARAVADSGATMTQTANILGTAQYLSPEQARGEVVDARSDIYSAGCLLFELLTGRPPFQGESPVAVAYQHVRENPPSPSTVNPDVTAGVDAIVMKALAKNPDNRYQSAAEMKADIGRALQGTAVIAPPVLVEETQPLHAITEPVAAVSGRRKGAYIGLILGVLLVLGILGFAAWALLGGDSNNVRAPSVIGKSVADATADIEGIGLVVGEITPQPSDEKKNTVLAQNPIASTELEKGDAVNLTVSSGPEQVTVPRLVGFTESEAIVRIQDAGLEYSGKTTEEPDDRPAGTVIASSPAAGKQVDANRKISLVVSSGEVAVPSVVGDTEEEASAVLIAEGFNPNVVPEQTDAFPAGQVIDQSPDGETFARLGTVVTITVAEALPQPTPTPTETPSPSETSTSPKPEKTKTPGPPPSPGG